MTQQVIVAVLVLTAVAFVGRRVWRTIAAARAPKSAGCASGCGCETTVPATETGVAGIKA